MIEKSAPKWITEGQTIELTCKTNKPWNICRWTLPNGKNCDGNKGNLYEVACQYDSRIKFLVSIEHIVPPNQSPKLMHLLLIDKKLPNLTRDSESL